MNNWSNLEQLKADYIKDRETLLIDNTKIFKKLRGYDKYDSSVYIWVNTDIKADINLGWNIHMNNAIVYIGHGRTYGDISFWRSFNHENDLLCDVIYQSSNYKCYIVSTGLPKIHAQVLESYFIKVLLEEYNYNLTKRGVRNIKLKMNQLINKSAEIKWRDRANDFLKIN